MIKKIRCTWNQKDWYRNIANIVINYDHRSEEDSMHLVHMKLPKCQIDRTPYYPRVWRWK